MNYTQTFLHPHWDHSVKPIDARAKMTPNLPWADCYSVGFRISTHSQDSFVHAMIFADSDERLRYGIDQEIEILRAISSEQPILNIDVVYLRSMLTLDRDFLSQESWDEIEGVTRSYLKQRDDNHFVLYGLVNESQFVVLDMHTKNAMNVMVTTKYKRIDTPLEKFIVLGVQQAHPASAWFDTMFHEAARRMSAIEDRETHWSGQLH